MLPESPSFDNSLPPAESSSGENSAVAAGLEIDSQIASAEGAQVSPLSYAGTPGADRPIQLEPADRAERADWDHKCSRSASLLESFYHAVNGVKVALKGQRNLRIHFLITPCVLVLAYLLQVEAWGYALLLMSIGLVITAELINTAIEHMVDIQAGYRYHLSARYAKDTAAAAVMLAAFTAVLVGLAVFLPRLFVLVSSLR